MRGEDKGLLSLGSQTMIEHVIAALRPQVGGIIINANRNVMLYGTFGYRVVSDLLPDFPGPLAGIASGLAAATTPYVAIVPCDAPAFPADMIDRLYAALASNNAEAAVIHDGEHMQPLFALLTGAVLPTLEAAIANGERKVRTWLGSINTVTVNCADQAHAFLNINDLAAYEAFLRSTPAVSL